MSFIPQYRLLAAHCTTDRRAGYVSRVVSSINVEPVFARCELDTHADTCALGANFVPLFFTGRVCDVSPYNSNHYEAEKNVPIISGGTAYTCQESGQTYILVINEGLWLGTKMEHSLLNPNQLRFNGISVQDNPFDTTTPLSIEHDDVTIPLSILGTNIFLNTHTPTQHELDSCPHIHLTSDTFLRRKIGTKSHTEQRDITRNIIHEFQRLARNYVESTEQEEFSN